MDKSKVVKVYILLIVVHFLHVVEELLGDASFISNIYKGTTNFLVINLLLLTVPIILLFFVYKNKRSAYLLSYIYATIMIIDGLNHIIKVYPGVYTGVGLIILGFILILTLARNKLK